MMHTHKTPSDRKNILTDIHNLYNINITLPTEAYKENIQPSRIIIYSLFTNQIDGINGFMIKKAS